METSKIFEGVKVVELASVLAGPLVGSFFSELGAQVVKFENGRAGGDVTRQWKQKSEPHEKVSAYYASANYCKEALICDLKDQEAKSVLVEHLRSADIVISNFQAKVEKDLGLSYEDIKAVKPDIIFVQLDAYSESDQRPGYDMVMQAESGFLSMTGTRDGQLVKMPVALIDVIAGHQMKEAVLIAMLKQAKTGAGSHIRVSLFKSAISALANQAANYLNTGLVPKPKGTDHPNISIYGSVFETADKVKFMLAVASDQQFKKLGETLSLPADKMDYFCTNQSRLAMRQKVHSMLQGAIGSMPWKVINQKLVDHNLPFSHIYTLDKVMEQPLAQEMINSFKIEGQYMKNVKNIAFEFKA